MGQKKGYGAKEWAIGDKVGICLRFDSPGTPSSTMYGQIHLPLCAGGTLTFYKNGAVMESGPKSVAYAGGMTGKISASIRPNLCFTLDESQPREPRSCH